MEIYTTKDGEVIFKKYSLLGGLEDFAAQFCDTLKMCIRDRYGCTQAELAKRSNVSLRSIQMYEQRNKDINRASAETVLSLAKVLGCTMEDLLEK